MRFYTPIVADLFECRRLASRGSLRKSRLLIPQLRCNHSSISIARLHPAGNRKAAVELALTTMANKAPSLVVLTLNVWNREGPWPRRLSLIRSWIHRLQPDLIGFQEVVDSGHAQELLSELGLHSEWMGTTTGIAIAARWPIQDRQELWLPGDGKSTGGPALRDFNTDSESAEIRYLKGLQSLEGTSAYWRDAWDHAGDVWPSDHFGVLARVRTT